MSFVFHLGARTDTTEMNKSVFDELNLNYSKKVWNACVEYGLPLVYASSAAHVTERANTAIATITRLSKSCIP